MCNVIYSFSLKNTIFLQELAWMDSVVVIVHYWLTEPGICRTKPNHIFFRTDKTKQNCHFIDN
jgi:hypothetical protein